MSKFIAFGAVFAVLGIAAATSSAGSNPNTLTLAVYGDCAVSGHVGRGRSAPEDLPSSTRHPAFINTFNADPSVQEVVHVGDIHSGSEACTVPTTSRSSTSGRRSRSRSIYTPGDNEWSDCTKAKELPGSDFRQATWTSHGDPLCSLTWFARSSSRTLAGHSASTRCR